jgi:hypothetical protein
MASRISPSGRKAQDAHLMLRVEAGGSDRQLRHQLDPVVRNSRSPVLL